MYWHQFLNSCVYNTEFTSKYLIFGSIRENECTLSVHKRLNLHFGCKVKHEVTQLRSNPIPLPAVIDWLYNVLAVSLVYFSRVLRQSLVQRLFEAFGGADGVTVRTNGVEFFKSRAARAS